MRPILTLTVLAAATLGSFAFGQPAPDQSQCRAPHGPGVEYLRGLVRQIHPEVFALGAQGDSVVVGVVFDGSCKVVRHAARRRRVTDGQSVDSTLAGLFPALATGPLYFSDEGFADLVPPRMPGGHPVVFWAVLRSQ